MSGFRGCPPSVAVPRWIVMPYRGWKGQTFASTHGRLQVLPEQQSAGLRALTASVYPRVGFDWCGGRRLTTAKAARSGLPVSHPCQRPWPKVSPVHTVHPVAVVAPPGIRMRSRLHAYSASRNPALLGRESAVGLVANGASSSPETPKPTCAARPNTVSGLAVTSTATPPGSISSGVVHVDWRTKRRGCLLSSSIVTRSAPSICEKWNQFQSPCDLPLTVPVLRSYLPNGLHQ